MSQRYPLAKNGLVAGIDLIRHAAMPRDVPVGEDIMVTIED